MKLILHLIENEHETWFAVCVKAGELHLYDDVCKPPHAVRFVRGFMPCYRHIAEDLGLQSCVEKKSASRWDIWKDTHPRISLAAQVAASNERIKPLLIWPRGVRLVVRSY